MGRWERAAWHARHARHAENRQHTKQNCHHRVRGTSSNGCSWRECEWRRLSNDEFVFPIASVDLGPGGRDIVFRTPTTRGDACPVAVTPGSVLDLLMELALKLSVPAQSTAPVHPRHAIESGWAHRSAFCSHNGASKQHEIRQKATRPGPKKKVPWPPPPCHYRLLHSVARRRPGQMAWADPSLGATIAARGSGPRASFFFFFSAATW